MSVKNIIKVTNRGLSPVLSITQGTDAVEFEFTISDYNIPSGSSAVAYNIQPTGNIVNQLCSISGNTISITPRAYFFLRGKNYMQFQITNNKKNLFSFLIEVWCSPNISEPEVTEVQDSTVVSQLLSQVGLLDSRLNNITSLKDGSTTGDAELQDIRVGANGATYKSAGESVREQAEFLNSMDISLSDIISKQWGNIAQDIMYHPSFEMERGRYNANNEFLIKQDGNYARCARPIKVTGRTTVVLMPGYSLGILYVDKNGKATWSSTLSSMDKAYQISSITLDRYSFVFYVGKTGSDILLDEAKNAVKIYSVNENPIGIDTNKNLNIKLNLEFLFGTSYNNSDYITFIGNITEQAAVPHMLFFPSGILNIKNPNGYTFILYEIDINNSYKKLNRWTSSEADVKFNVEYGHVYYMSLYKGGLTAEEFIQPECYVYKNVYNNIFKEIPLVFESGTFYGNGSDAPNDTRIRTQKIAAKENCMYIFTFPTGYIGNVNRKKKNGGIRANLTYVRQTSFSFIDCTDFIRFALYKEDLSRIDIPQISSLVRLYEVPIPNSGEITVAASDSLINGDIKTDGTNDQRILQGLLNNLDSGIKICLSDGTFHFSEFYTTKESKQKALLFLDDIAYYSTNSNKKTKTFEVCGIHTTRANSGQATVFTMGDTLEDFSSGEYSFLLVPRAKPELDTTALSSLILKVSNIKFLANVYTKKFIFIDATHAQAAMIDNIEVRGDGTRNGLSVFPTKPNIDCVGIRVGYGSNNGIQNYVKHCMAYYCGKGYSCCGEHYIFEDDLAHHCYIGFAFGDRVTRGNFEHPNILLGCSIEGCYRTMLLTKNGETVERDYTDYDTESKKNVRKSTIIAIGISTERRWDIPTDELDDDNITSDITKPILEIIKGAYQGRIEMDSGGENPFESGSGKFMKFISYGGYLGFLEGKGNGS